MIGFVGALLIAGFPGLLIAAQADLIDTAPAVGIGLICLILGALLVGAETGSS